MASLRLTFPDKDQPTVIALTGARFTIGRLPLNTIQIIDRTVSGLHAELISENGHYRLHDRGSSNGTFVNGERIDDYHLNEACTITLGSVEIQFSPEEVAAAEEAEAFPSRAEVNGVRKENAELRATVEALREEAAALKKGSPLADGDAKMFVPKEEFDALVVEREALKESKLRLDDELTSLKTDLAVLRRDRSNLQLAYDGVQAELEEARRKFGSAGGVSSKPMAAAAPAAPTPAEQPAATEPTVAKAAPPAPPTSKVEPSETKSPGPFVPKPAAAVPAEAPRPPMPPSLSPKPTGLPNKPGALPMKSAALPPKPGALPAKPAGPAAPASPASAAPAAPVPAAAKAPPGLGSGIRPMAKPPIAPAGATSESLPNVPTTRLAPRPMPGAKLPTQPTVKLSATPLPKVGPKGTQKLTD